MPTQRRTFVDLFQETNIIDLALTGATQRIGLLLLEPSIRVAGSPLSRLCALIGYATNSTGANASELH